MELKPCPFCGSEPVTRIYPLHSLKGKSKVEILVRCPECGTSKSITVTEEEKPLTFNDIYIAIEQCEELWNRRI